MIERSRILAAGVRSQAVTHDIEAGRAAVLFAAGVRQQAFTLAIMDSLLLIASVATACLVIVACLRGLKVGFPQLIAPPAQTNFVPEKHAKGTVGCR